jgi:GT2 family glycosyltransferase
MRPLLSIVTVFYNGSAVNALFLDSLKKYSRMPHELIAIDNASTDDSASIFVKAKAAVIRVEKPVNYSQAMNFGTERSCGEYLCHVNNDVVFSHGWDINLIDKCKYNGYDIVCPSSLEIMSTWYKSKRSLRKWNKLISCNALNSDEQIRDILIRMYGDYDLFCRRYVNRNHDKVIQGINGHTVLMSRAAWDKIGPYDEDLLATDWDLFLRSKIRENELGDLKAPVITCSSYVHHHMGFTRRSLDGNPLWDGTDFLEKFDMDVIYKHWWNKMHLYPAPSIFSEPTSYLRYAVKSFLGLYNWGDRW